MITKICWSGNYNSMHYYVLNEDHVIEGFARCIDKINRLLNDALIIAENSKEHELAHAFGLYTLAIEEYGKAWFLLNSMSDRASNGKYCIPEPVFKGKESHRLKFEKALAHLPDICIKIQLGYRVRFATHHTKTIPTKKGSISVAGGTTGSFFDGSTHAIDLDTRMESFYVDWDDKLKQWKEETAITRTELLEAIDTFKEHLHHYGAM